MKEADDKEDSRIEELQEKLASDFDSLSNDDLVSLKNYYREVRNDARTLWETQNVDKKGLAQTIYDSYAEETSMFLIAQDNSESEGARAFVEKHGKELDGLEQRRREFLNEYQTKYSIEVDDDLEALVSETSLQEQHSQHGEDEDVESEVDGPASRGVAVVHVPSSRSSAVSESEILHAAAERQSGGRASVADSDTQSEVADEDVERQSQVRSAMMRSSLGEGVRQNLARGVRDDESSIAQSEDGQEREQTHVPNVTRGGTTLGSEHGQEELRARSLAQQELDERVSQWSSGVTQHPSHFSPTEGEDIYGEIRVFSTAGGKRGYLEEVIEEHNPDILSRNHKLGKEQYEELCIAITQRMESDFKRGALKVINPEPIDTHLSKYNIKGKTLEEIERSDGKIDFKPEDGLDAVIRVQRKNPKTGELVEAYDTIEYQEGKISRIIIGGEGESRLGNIGVPQERGVMVAGQLSPEEERHFAPMASSRISEEQRRLQQARRDADEIRSHGGLQIPPINLEHGNHSGFVTPTSTPRTQPEVVVRRPGSGSRGK